MARLLQEAGISCERHSSHFALGDADEAWIPVVAARGWATLTRDVQISHKPVEREAWKSSGALVIFIRGKALSTTQMVSALVTARANKLEEFIAKRTRPMIINISPDGRFRVPEGGGGERRGGVKK